MILHLLHHPSLYEECAALLTEHDTLLLLDEAADAGFINTLGQLPCSVRVLNAAANSLENHALGLEYITVDEWVGLVITHRHSMTWG